MLSSCKYYTYINNILRVGQYELHDKTIFLIFRRHGRLEPLRIEGVMLLTADKVNYAVGRDRACHVASGLGGCSAERELARVAAAVNFPGWAVVCYQSLNRPRFAVIETQRAEEAADLALFACCVGQGHFVPGKRGKEKCAVGEPFELKGPAEMQFAASGGVVGDLTSWVRTQLGAWIGESRRQPLRTRTVRDWELPTEAPTQIIPA